jgi:putative hydrolase of the HAD superfamily
LNRIGQHLLIDADDTLWENNIYFERTFHQFCDFLDHSSLTREQVRAALDEIELVNNKVYGYGSLNFGRNMVECYHRLVERQISPSDAEHIMELALAIQEHPLEIIEGVPETLAYLSARHDLVMFTKGNMEEQGRKITASGLARYFRDAVIVKEKDAEAYRQIVESHSLALEESWMVGNSPKSDINPAMEAGLGAVYVPHSRTWHLEHAELAGAARLLVAENFADLAKFF